MKRLLDVTVAGLALLALLPLGLVIAAVLSCTGEREIFYRQARVGQGGRRFDLLKFATMLKDSPNLGSGTVTVANDPRVLPVGRFLRKTKINELPQLLNVLLGDMSLVGPRPLTPQVFDYYSPQVRRRIGEVLPGLTGLGSIVFRDEEKLFADNGRSAADIWREEIAPYKGRLELWYVEHQSLWLDIKLILLTAVVVLAPTSSLHERWLPGIPSRDPAS